MNIDYIVCGNMSHVWQAKSLNAFFYLSIDLSFEDSNCHFSVILTDVAQEQNGTGMKTTVLVSYHLDNFLFANVVSVISSGRHRERYKKMKISKNILFNLNLYQCITSPLEYQKMLSPPETDLSTSDNCQKTFHFFLQFSVPKM